MKFSFLPPALIFYTELPEPKAGTARGPVVHIRTGYEKDEGVLRHELTHVGLWWLTLHIPAVFSKRYRIWNEARAYRVQMKHPDRHGNYLSLDDAAARLAGSVYGFGITQEQAKQFIRGAS